MVIPSASVRKPWLRWLNRDSAATSALIVAAVQRLHKPYLQEDLQSPLHSTDLSESDGGNPLHRVRDIFVLLELSTMLQQFQVQLEQDVEVQDTILYTFSAVRWSHR